MRETLRVPGRRWASFMEGNGASSFRREIRRWTQAFIDALFPPRCLGCGVFYDFRAKGDAEDSGPLIMKEAFFQMAFEEVVRRVLSPQVCPSCVQGFAPLAPPWCPVCGVMFAGRQGHDHLCPACDGISRAFGKARAVGAYAQGWMTAVHRLKYEGKIQLARPLGRLLFMTYCRLWKEAPMDLVLPVPLHRRRMQERGFNQAYLLVRKWPRYAAQSGKAPGAFRIARDILFRTRWEHAQTGLSRSRRRASIRGAFRVKRPDAVAGKKILLVDDVHTTGATVEACAEALTQAGALQVDVLTLARTL